ncbi:MAG TPA: DUF3147 family protein [Vitreimonas sp.]|nr:DUF3147 family protein [Vitreimonas sp.]
MDTLFLIKLVLAFLIGGSWVILATYLADKLGPKIGGLVTGLPSTLLFGLFFIGWTQSPQAAIAATSIIPLIGGIGSLFLAIFVASLPLGLIRALCISILSWAILTFIALSGSFHNYFLSFFSYFLLTSLSFFYMEYIVEVKVVEGKRLTYSALAVASRGLLSGLIIVLSIVLGKVGGPVLGGVMALFPVMFTSTLTIAYLSHGAEFCKSLAKSAMLASISIIVYSVSVRLTYIPVGIFLGTFISTIISMITGYLIFKFLISRFN